MPRNKNPEETVGKILDASLRLFIKKGFDRTTINDIVGELSGMTRGAFYHHFESKREVLYALLEKKYELLELETCASMNGIERIRLMFNHSLRPTGNVVDDQLMQILIDLLKDPTALAEQVKENQGEGSQWLFELIEIGMEDGSIRKQNPEILTEVILLLMNFWIMPSVYPMETFEKMEAKILMIKEILDGLGCPILDDDGLKTMYGLADRFSKN